MNELIPLDSENKEQPAHIPANALIPLDVDYDVGEKIKAIDAEYDDWFKQRSAESDKIPQRRAATWGTSVRDLGDAISDLPYRADLAMLGISRNLWEIAEAGGEVFRVAEATAKNFLEIPSAYDQANSIEKTPNRVTFAQEVRDMVTQREQYLKERIANRRGVEVEDGKLVQYDRPGWDSITGVAQNVLIGGVTELVRQGPMVATAFLTKNPWMAMSTVIGWVYGENYNQFRAAGYDPLMSMQWAGVNALAEGMTNNLAISKVLEYAGSSRGVKGFLGLGWNVLKNEAVQEEATEIINIAVDKMTLNPNMSASEALHRLAMVALTTPVTALGLYGTTRGLGYAQDVGRQAIINGHLTRSQKERAAELLREVPHDEALKEAEVTGKSVEEVYLRRGMTEQPGRPLVEDVVFLQGIMEEEKPAEKPIEEPIMEQEVVAPIVEPAIEPDKTVSELSNILGTEKATGKVDLEQEVALEGASQMIDAEQRNSDPAGLYTGVKQFHAGIPFPTEVLIENIKLLAGKTQAQLTILEEVARRLYLSGNKKMDSFIAGMQNNLGTMFEQFKPYMNQLFNNAGEWYTNKYKSEFTKGPRRELSFDEAEKMLNESIDQDLIQLSLNQKPTERRAKFERQLESVMKYADKAREAFKTSFAQLQDITHNNIQLLDFYRIMPKAFGAAGEQMLVDFDNAKARMVKRIFTKTEEFKKLGIDTLEDAQLVMNYGEELVDEATLRKNYGDERANKIIAATNWLRIEFNRMWADINELWAKIYPNDPTRLPIKYRQNYFSRMRAELGILTQIYEKLWYNEKITGENAKGFDIAEQQSDIIGKDFAYQHARTYELGLNNKQLMAAVMSGDMTFSQLVDKLVEDHRIKAQKDGIVISEKKLKKMANIEARKIKRHINKRNVIQGYLQYLQAYAFEMEMAPQIVKLRTLAAALMKERPDGSMDNTIEYLIEFTRHLSGEAHRLDNWGRNWMGDQLFDTITALGSRMRTNLVVGNVNTMISQAFNFPQGIAEAGRDFFPGLSRSYAQIFENDPILKQSTLISERYDLPEGLNDFRLGTKEQVKKAAEWMTVAFDKITTRIIWNSMYEQGRRIEHKNPVQYADMKTRELIGGRGIGEVPLWLTSKMVKFVMPFQLEVANVMRVQGKWFKKREWMKLVTFYIMSWLMNGVSEYIRGYRVSIDPINALYEGTKLLIESDDKKKGMTKFVGHLAGEFLGSVPGGNLLAMAFVPRYLGGMRAEDVLGKDKIRFDLPYRVKGANVSEKLRDIFFKVIPPLGGEQMSKTVRGVEAFAKGEATGMDPTKMRYPIEQDVTNFVNAVLFGPVGVREGRQYFKEEGRILSKKQTERVRKSSNAKAEFEKIYAERAKRTAKRKKKAGN